jgi:hypothetical protein
MKIKPMVHHHIWLESEKSWSIEVGTTRSRGTDGEADQGHQNGDDQSRETGGDSIANVFAVA